MNNYNFVLDCYDEYVKIRSPNNYSKNKEWILGFGKFIYDKIIQKQKEVKS